jgi:hypothetical protein
METSRPFSGLLFYFDAPEQNKPPEGGFLYDDGKARFVRRSPAQPYYRHE